MKRLLSMALVLVLLFSALPLASFAADSDPVLYKQNDKGPELLTIKNRLFELQYYTSTKNFNESYTSNMTTVIKKVQKINGLKQTGKITQSLYDLIFSDQCKNAYGVVWNDVNNVNVSRQYVLQSDEQFTVSSLGNIVILSLDNFSNAYMPAFLAQYPNAMDMFSDFTYYSNCDPVYYCTYPSIAHMITGYKLTTDVTIGEWFHNAWTSDSCNYFFDKLKENGYEFHFYTNTNANPGIKGEAIGKIQNLVYGPDYPGTLVYAKHETEFYDEIKAHGLSTSDRAKFVIFQHLGGLHTPYVTSAEGTHVESATQQESVMGWFTILNAYLEEMKRLNLYDDATIIITSDHGDKKQDMQCVYFIKEPHAKHDKLQTTDAPISHEEFQATLLSFAGVEKGALPGKTIYDFSAGEERERTIMANFYNKRYSKVPMYNGTGYGSHNVWYCFTYTGDNTDLEKRIKRGPSEIIKMNQSFN